MFSLFQKKEKQGKEVVFSLGGMHCTSCALNIDGALEELEGVFCAQTSYAHSTVKVEFDPSKVNTTQLIDTIKQEGYQVLTKDD